MPTPDAHDPHASASASAGYETTDVSVGGIAAFLVSLAIFVGVFFVLCFGMGKLINNGILKADGPPGKWTMFGNRPEGKRQDMTSSAVLEQEQLRKITQSFPTPRLETDNGDQDVAEMHAREDLLLDHYTWIDEQHGKLRIPIERAMALIAKQGLPVAPAGQSEALMTGDKPLVVPVPLTDGFAPTGYEQHFKEVIEQQRERGEKP